MALYYTAYLIPLKNVAF